MLALIERVIGRVIERAPIERRATPDEQREVRAAVILARVTERAAIERMGHAAH